ncbi:MAG: hypothetical protein PHI32_00105 [Dysgonamonadaceae bacterium]|nr:hypothetical protein [Dysgonamonadaceae bacterium]MDD4727654.1 hypothetical protein [Dysgonamonadaceae bacterium]
MTLLIKVYDEMVIDIVITYKIVLESFAGILRRRIPKSESVKLELRR